MEKGKRISYFGEGVEYTIVPLKGGSAYMTLCGERLKGESTTAFHARMAQILKKAKATPLMSWVFGGIHPVTRIHDAATERMVRKADWPVIWLNGDGNPKPGVTSAQFIAVIKPKGKIQTARIGKGTAITAYSDGLAEYGYIGGSLNVENEPDADISVQAEASFEAMRALTRFIPGANFRDIARTWLYLDKLLTWYDDFNVVRTAFFKKMKVFTDGIVPSSTGIGAINQDGSSTSLSAIVVKPRSSKVKVAAVPSPLQCPALDYKSSFSRAHLVTHPEYRQLMISGTASILPGGESTHIDDCPKQIDLTMRVVEGILKAQKFKWADTTRAICYFKDIKDVKHYHQYLQTKGIADFPTICVQCDVCRDELLFEIELDLMQSR